MFGKFVFILTIITAVFFASLIILKNIIISDFNAALFSLLLTYLNALIGTKVASIALKKSGKSFMLYSLGSMTVRLFVIMGFIIMGILFFKFDRFTFIISLFSFYFIFLVSEIIFLLRIQKMNKSLS